MTKRQGHLLHTADAEQRISLTQAEITPERIALDWTAEGQRSHLIAKSRDGVHFNGHYGYRGEKSTFDCELVLYSARHEELLLGTWHAADPERSGTILIRLSSTPAEARPVSAPIAAPPQSSKSQRHGSQPVPEVVRHVLSAAQKQALPSQESLPSAAVHSKPLSAAGAAYAGAPPTDEKVAAPFRFAGAAAPAGPPASASIDHLLTITPEEFELRDLAELEQELLAAPASAVFKVSHYALAAELKALAARIFAERNSELLAAPPAPAAERAKESALLRAQKRRSTKRGSDR